MRFAVPYVQWYFIFELEPFSSFKCVNFVLQCEEDEEKIPLGPVALGLRLLKERGMIPVMFTGDELQGKKLLTQKIELIKAKLQKAAGNISWLLPFSV